MSNPAISLPPKMILKLLDELTGLQSDSSVINSFCDLLNAHPIVRASRDRSLGPSASALAVSISPETSSDPTGSVDIDLDPPSDDQDCTDGLPAVQSSEMLDATQSSACDQELDNSVEKGGSGGGEGGKKCCRNGVKRVVLRQSKKNGKKILAKGGEGGDSAVGGQAKRARRGKEKTLVEERVDREDSERESDEEVEEEVEEEKEEATESVGKKRKRKGKKTLPVWMTDGTPPPVDDHTCDLIDKLSCLDLNDALNSLIMLSKQLTQPIT